MFPAFSGRSSSVRSASNPTLTRSEQTSDSSSYLISISLRPRGKKKKRSNSKALIWFWNLCRWTRTLRGWSISSPSTNKSQSSKLAAVMKAKSGLTIFQSVGVMPFLRDVKTASTYQTTTPSLEPSYLSKNQFHCVKDKPLQCKVAGLLSPLLWEQSSLLGQRRKTLLRKTSSQSSSISSKRLPSAYIRSNLKELSCRRLSLSIQQTLSTNNLSTSRSNSSTALAVSNPSLYRDRERSNSQHTLHYQGNILEKVLRDLEGKFLQVA